MLAILISAVHLCLHTDLVTYPCIMFFSLVVLKDNSALSLASATLMINFCKSVSKVQNTAARLVSGAGRHDHITPVLATLHWLPVRQQIAFKTAVLVWKCLNGEAPRYLADLCVPAASTDGRRQSRSAVSGALLVPWTRTSTGQRSFAVHGLRTWNRLPAALRSPGLSLHAFKRQLKACLLYTSDAADE